MATISSTVVTSPLICHDSYLMTSCLMLLYPMKSHWSSFRQQFTAMSTFICNDGHFVDIKVNKQVHINCKKLGLHIVAIFVHKTTTFSPVLQVTSAFFQ